MPDERIILCLNCGQQNRLRAKVRPDLARCGRCGEPLAPPQRRMRAPGWVALLLVMAAGALGYVVYVHQPYYARAGPERHEAPTFNAPQVAISTGVVRIRPGKERMAPLEIRTSSGNDYFIKLFNVADGQEELAMYIEGGRTFTIDVPVGTYEFRYAAGNVWYGERYRFGPDTAYFGADKQFTFYREGNSVNGYTIELILQVDGNLRTRRIDPSQF